MSIIDNFSFPAVDVISSHNKFVDEIPAARIDVCVFLVTSFWGYEYALLYHCIIDNEMRTFLRGKFAKLGLGEYLRLLWLILS